MDEDYTHNEIYPDIDKCCECGERSHSCQDCPTFGGTGVTIGFDVVHRADAERIIERISAAVRFLYPEEMTPQAKRVFDSILEEERLAR